MADDIPLLSYVPFETLQDSPGSPQDATPKAKTRWEEYTRSIASAANGMDETSLLEFVTAHKKEVLRYLTESTKETGGKMFDIVSRAPPATNPSAGAAAKWLVITYKCRELMDVASTLMQHRNGMTMWTVDIDRAVESLGVRAHPTVCCSEEREGEVAQQAGEEEDQERDQDWTEEQKDDDHDDDDDDQSESEEEEEDEEEEVEEEEGEEEEEEEEDEKDEEGKDEAWRQKRLEREVARERIEEEEEEARCAAAAASTEPEAPTPAPAPAGLAEENPGASIRGKAKARGRNAPQNSSRSPLGSLCNSDAASAESNPEEPAKRTRHR